MEYFDVLDEKGNKTGETKSRDEVHKKGLFHRTIFVWIINSNGELLIQKRSSSRDKNPDMWTISASGHLSTGDDSIMGALRELKEEIGITTTKTELQYLFTVKEHKIHSKDYIDNEFIDVFIINKDIEIKDLKLQVEEVSDVKFIPYKKLQEMIEKTDSNIVEHKEMYNKLFNILKEKFTIRIAFV